MADIVDYFYYNKEILFTYKGSYVFIESSSLESSLEGDNTLELFETENIKNFYIHPITNQLFNDEQLQYIQSMYECYNNYQHIDITRPFVSSLIQWYDDIRRNMSFEQIKTKYTESYNIIKYFTSISDFQSHFIDFNAIYTEFDPIDITYERSMVENSLIDSGITGKWFLRRSSRNRTETIPKWVNYYALSFIDKNKNIKHVLLKQHLGYGWTCKHKKWYTSFIDMLEDLLLKYDLPYDKRTSKYI